MKLFVLIFLFFIQNLYAQEYVLGEGKYFSTVEDENIIKNELLYESFKDVLKKELNTLGLNVDLFIKKSSEKISVELKNKRPDLKLQTEEYKKEYSDLEKKLIDLSKILPTYTVKSITRSTHEPNLRYMHIEAQTNREEIKRLYVEIIGESNKVALTTMYLMVNLDFKNFSPELVGAKSSSEIKEALEKSWIEFLDKNKPAIVSQVKILDKQDSQYEKWTQLKDQELINNLPEKFINSSLLQLHLVVEPIEMNEKFDDFAFKFSGNYYVKDMNSKNILNFGVIQNETKQFHFTDTKTKSSIFASYVYRLPLNGFLTLKSELKMKIGSNAKIELLKVYGYKNVGDLYSFLDWIKSKGAKFNLNGTIASFNKEHSELKIVLDGSTQEIKDLIKLMKQEKRNFTPDLIDSDGVLGVKLSYPEIIQGMESSQKNGTL